MNLQMSLQKQAFWTPSLAVVECLHHSNPRVARNIFLRKMYSISSEIARRFLNDKYWTNEVEVYVFK